VTLRASYRPPDEQPALADLTVGELLGQAVAATPDRVALVEGIANDGSRRRWTYAELAIAAERAARALALDFDPGERLALWAPGLPEWEIIQLGAAMAGLVLVPLNPAYRRTELIHALNLSGASGIFLTRRHRGASLADLLDEARPGVPALRTAAVFEEWEEFSARGTGTGPLPKVAATDPAQIQFTSGTTGAPKGALLSHRGIVNNARFSAGRAGVGEGGVWLNPLPMFHTGGCVFNALGSMATGATHVLQPIFDAGAALELVESEGVTFLCAVPTMLLAMMEHADFAHRDVTSLQYVLSGGAPVPPELVRRIESTLGVRYLMVYGQTEAGPTVTMTNPDDRDVDKAETIGRPLPHTEIRIVNDDGAVVPVGESGELRIRGYGVMLGYFGADQGAQPVDAEGWLRTGDLCSVDERGFLRITGRLKDVIIRGGENIAPREVEDALCAHPAVSEAAVVGLPDERYGEQVAAWVRLASGATASADELAAYLHERLARHKIPTSWYFVADLPRTPSGKVQKFVLRDQAHGSGGQPLNLLRTHS
jgi:fatty-acyl-CoA synthase